MAVSGVQAGSLAVLCAAYVRSLFSAHVSLLIPQISDCTLCLKSGKIVRELEGCDWRSALRLA
jgi:hypothetical protein